MSKYHGITHDVPEEELDKHKEEKCPKGIHAFDEVLSSFAHYLHCDACGIAVHFRNSKNKKEVC